METCFRTITNTIHITGLDTISITPSSHSTNYVGLDKFSSNTHEKPASVKEVNQCKTSEHEFPFFKEFYGDVVHKRKNLETSCDHFLDYEEFTFMFVDDILKTALDVITRKHKTATVTIEKRIESSTRNIMSWPTIENFNEALGAIKLEEYIDGTSEMAEDWQYSTKLVATQSNDVSDFYKYEVQFGIPTKIYPVPQATASVYFTYEVSRVKPRHCPVDVTYQVEASNCVMIPGRNNLTEELLFRVIDAKIKCFKLFD